jgi:hypothetical protein
MGLVVSLQGVTSAIHPKADIRQRNCNVRFVPIADIHQTNPT